jgi:acyl-coenzyme A synthetase/AMP-(fatty) acid ligase
MLAIDLNAGDRILIAPPMFHVGGAFCASLPALGSGATMIVPTAGGFRNPDVVANFWRVIESQRVTHGALVPTPAVCFSSSGSSLSIALERRRISSFCVKLGLPSCATSSRSLWLKNGLRAICHRRGRPKRHA